MAERGERLRLTILGGYLGSGKTTWLRHQLHVGQFGQAPHVVVNEAAQAAVDDALLPAAGGVTLIAGGCACCDARDDLLKALRALCDRRSAGAGPERAILETSGLADPAVIAATVARDPVLTRHIRLEETVVAVDALNGIAQLNDDPLWRAQATAADRIVVTKTDAATPAALGRLLAALRHLNPGAAIEGSAQGSPAPLPPVPQGTALPEFSDASGKAPLRSIEVTLPAADWAGFSLWLSALLHARGNDIVRVKGVIRTPAGRLLLQGVRKTVQPPEILPPSGPRAGDNTLVLFARGVTAADLSRSLARFCAPQP